MLAQLTSRTLSPISFLSSQLGMTGLLVALGLLGQTKLAVDVGIVQAATVALFFGFSGNARSVIFASESPTITLSFLVARLILILPLSVVAFYLGSVLGGVSFPLCAVLILRKCSEWLAELHLSHAERIQSTKLPLVHLALQSSLLLIAVASAVAMPSYFLLALAAWAVLPLVPSILFLLRLLIGQDRAPAVKSLLLPHFGSTAVAGIGVYVFRLLLLLLVGPEVAGTLFTAFAIGGLLGSVFVFGFGPTMILAEQRSGRISMEWQFKLMLFVVFGAGAVVTVTAHIVPAASVFAGQGLLFWQTLGFSILGSVVMVFAQMQRLRDLQHGSKQDVFAPDVLVEMTSVIFIPAIFFMFGVDGMSWLSLFYASVAFVFYAMMDVRRASKIVPEHLRDALRWGVSVLLIFPIFANLESGFFRSPTFIFESDGNIAKLPFPISVVACYLGIALLGNYRRANFGLAMVFGFFVVSVLTTISSTFDSNSMEQAKLFLVLQHILPMFAIALGMMIENHQDNHFIFEKATLCVISFIMPFQLVATWIQDKLFLTPFLYWFSIYQHLQYTPVMFIAVYTLALFSLWDTKFWRWLLLIITPLLAVYTSVSGSMLAVFLGCAGSVAFALRCKTSNFGRWAVLGARTIPVAFVATFVIYNFWPKSIGNVVDSRPSQAFITNTQSPLGIPFASKVTSSGLANVTERFEIWAFYLSSLRDKPSSLLFGSSSPPARSEFPSAHNYYLYLVYLFGLGPLLVLGAAIAYTVTQIVRNRDRILQSQSTVGLCLVVLFLLFADNMFKEGMRMPYAGILTFFLWGLLLARLEWFGSRMTLASTEVCKG